VKRYLKNFIGFGFFRSKAFFSVKNQSKVMMLIFWFRVKILKTKKVEFQNNQIDLSYKLHQNLLKEVELGSVDLMVK
jgi:hypothetical protein